nr:sodium-dependent phosphate transport protein 1, chloroplastic [Ipomoea batatas]GMD27105.1 sodium-dependent phosphate transport protein 1, chloroplastic [Ipomoea batatas]
MTARALLLSYYNLPPKRHCSPDAIFPKRSFSSRSHAHTLFEFGSPFLPGRGVRRGLIRRTSWRAWADVKSKTYGISESVPDSLKFEDALNDAVLTEDEDDGETVSGFPKRWVIVLLCFSAFLLCNMDRVSHHFFFIS